MAAPDKVDVQIRGVPAELRDRLKQRAQSKGLSMSRYVIEIVRDNVQRPTREEWWAEWHKRPVNDIGVSAAELLHEAAREEGWED